MKVQHCPYCNSSNILKFEDDYFCQECAWDSIAVNSLNKPLLDFFSLRQSHKGDLASSQPVAVPSRQGRPATQPITRSRNVIDQLSGRNHEKRITQTPSKAP